MQQAPWLNGNNHCSVPQSKLIEAKCTKRSCAVTWYWPTMVAMCAAMAPWVRATPLGRPVEPEV
ncbi:hypothetical protein D3C81_583120 [compost metagenome]